MRTYTATLECTSRFTGRNHTVSFTTAPPGKGAEVWCLLCARMSAVERAPYEWRVKCRSCTYTRGGDTGETRARDAGRAHAKRHPAHRVVLFHGERTIHVWEPRSDALKNSFKELCDSLLTGRAG